jgi:nucleoside-diphosphate-sugar epimerase
MRKRIIITGGAGFIGSAVILRWTQSSRQNLFEFKLRPSLQSQRNSAALVALGLNAPLSVAKRGIQPARR